MPVFDRVKMRLRRKSREIAASLMCVFSGAAQACKPPSSLVVVFEEGSSSLGREQIVWLANSLDRFRRMYPHLDEVSIEGVARETASDARELARRRALETSRALRTLFDGVRVQVSWNLYPLKWSIHDGNYAGIQVSPPMEDTPDCNPIPIKP